MVDIAGILGGRGSGINIGGNGDGRRSGGRCREGGAMYVSGVSGSIQSPVHWHLCPQTIVFPRYMIVHPIFVKVHIVTTESSKWEARPGMMWANCAPGGNNGMLSVHVCIECTRLPFGRQVMMDDGYGGW